jgi:methylthioribose-1-phosphate isomerase
METPSETDSLADQAIVWRDGALELLDQRYLPAQVRYVRLTSAKGVECAIRDMVVRGAPAIGITAAYGAVLGAQEAWNKAGNSWFEEWLGMLDDLAGSRPTAVNLAWGLQRMRSLGLTLRYADPRSELLREALAIHDEDRAANRRMGELGAGLITGRTAIITHCNAGALATGGYGTALGVIRSAHAAGHVSRVYADETRPWLQGARLTAWELLQDGIPVTILADGAAASRLAQGDVGWVIVGADRVAANGDIANKIGTLGLAVCARHQGVKVMVVAPTSTLDMATREGRAIPIEQRDPEEVLSCAGSRTGAAGADAWNPVFDITPAGLVDALVTERGIVLRPDAKKLAGLMGL